MNTEEIATKADILELEKRLAALIQKTLKPENSEPYLTIQKAAAYLQMKPKRLYEYVHAGEINYIRNGRFIQFDKKDLDKYMSDRRVITDAEAMSKAYAISHV